MLEKNKFGMILLFILLVSILGGCKDYFINQYPNNAIIYYEDLRTPASTVRVTGSVGIPTYDHFRNDTSVLYFSPTAMNQVFIDIQFPHARISNSTIYPHIHWTYYEPKATGNVLWCLEYTCANVNDIFPVTSKQCVLDVAQEPFQHHMTDMIVINNTLNESSMCVMRLFRDATNPADTFPSDAGLLEFDVHYLTHFYGQKNGHVIGP